MSADTKKYAGNTSLSAGGLRAFFAKAPTWGLPYAHHMPPLDTKRVAVIILTYNDTQNTLACLKALQQSTVAPLRIIVVDNGSPGKKGKKGECAASLLSAWAALHSAASPADPPVMLALSSLTDIPGLPPTGNILLSLPDNNGYAAGNNVGLRFAMQDKKCTAFWILNNDTEAQADALRALCERLDQRPEAGMAGSTLVYAHEPDTVQCAAGYSLNPFTATAHALWGMRPLPATLAHAPEGIEKKLSYLCGASVLLRREMLETTGLLAEEFFLYYEDAEFGLRARKAGFAMAWAPHSVVLHKEGASTGAASGVGGKPLRRPAWVDYLTLRNRVYLAKKHSPWMLPTVLAGFVPVGVNRIRRGQWQRLPLLVRAVWDGLCGRMGKTEHTQ